MLSGQKALGYSTRLPTQLVPAVELGKDDAHHITSKQLIGGRQEKNSMNKVSYDFGANKNKPLSHLRSTNTVAFVPSGNNEDIAQYLVEHQVERPMMSRDDWLRHVDQTVRRDGTHEEIRKKSTGIPSVKLERFTDDSIMKICHQQNNVCCSADNYDQLYACAQQNIGRNFDLNTPWIDVMIRHEQLQKTKIERNQLKFIPAH